MSSGLWAWSEVPVWCSSVEMWSKRCASPDSVRRFFWFIWALDTIPPLLAVVAAVKPDLARGVSTSFFAVIAPLNILMANSFYNAFDPQVFGLTEHMERFMKVSHALLSLTLPWLSQK